VVTERWTDELGRIVHGEWKTGAERDRAKQLAAECTIDLSELDRAVDRLSTKLCYTFPDCTRKTLESLRKKKLAHWFANSETNRSWLALNMNTEAAAGFPAFAFGDKTEREIDFVALRQKLARGARFDDALVRSILPEAARKKLDAGGTP
jgi:6-oxo-cyclohex-1-ene-carbonyl-CoA hydrolase